MRLLLLIISLWCIATTECRAQSNTTANRFKVLAIYENGGHHLAFSTEAKKWFSKLAIDSSFYIEYIQSTEQLDSIRLSKYQLFLQLDFPPYGWKEKAAHALEESINNGRIGWVGLHHASLLGEFDGFPIWPWFWKFMGSIRFKNYIADFASGTVQVEESNHPVMKELPAKFTINKEEWYTYDQSPRANVTVLASVDESSYQPDRSIKMGDHPVIWTNPAYKARNVYIFMGHSPDLFSNEQYCKLLANAISWAAQKN